MFGENNPCVRERMNPRENAMLSKSASQRRILLLLGANSFFCAMGQ